MVIYILLESNQQSKEDKMGEESVIEPIHVLGKISEAKPRQKQSNWLVDVREGKIGLETGESNPVQGV